MQGRFGNHIMALLEGEFRYPLSTRGNGIYEFETDDFLVEVVVRPEAELGLWLKFKKWDKRGNHLKYFVDTDLYKMDDPSNSSFIRSIESQITDVLHALNSGLIVVGTRKGRPAFVIPLSEGYDYIYAGWTSTTTRNCRTLEEVYKHNFVST